MKYLLWSKLYKQWYCKPKEGLTLDIDYAGKYTKEDAESLIREVGFEISKSSSNGFNLIIMITVPASLVVEGER